MHVVYSIKQPRKFSSLPSLSYHLSSLPPPPPTTSNGYTPLLISDMSFLTCGNNYKHLLTTDLVETMLHYVSCF